MWASQLYSDLRVYFHGRKYLRLTLDESVSKKIPPSSKAHRAGLLCVRSAAAVWTGLCGGPNIPQRCGLYSSCLSILRCVPGDIKLFTRILWVVLGVKDIIGDSK